LLHDNQFRNRDVTIFDSPSLDGESFLQVYTSSRPALYIVCNNNLIDFSSAQLFFFPGSFVCFVAVINRGGSKGRPHTHTHTVMMPSWYIYIYMWYGARLFPSGPPKLDTGPGLGTIWYTYSIVLYIYFFFLLFGKGKGG
jgi:hypothetical protein